MTLKYFKPNEVKGLDPKFIDYLDKARGLADVPFVITSGFRDPADNSEAGGKDDSAHLKGLAVDLHCDDSRSRFLMLQGIFAAGIHRIGIYDHHIHIDMDGTKDPHVIWVGLSH